MIKPLRTIINAVVVSQKISYEDRVLFLGSCFSDSIGTKLAKLKFDVKINHFGTLFNPSSIRSLIRRAISEDFFQKEEFFQKEDIWNHWELNTSCSSVDLTSNIDKLNLILKDLQNDIIHAKYVFITLGTAWVYRLKENDAIVANCHKMPASLFAKECL